jgi:hypothetical protein
MIADFMQWADRRHFVSVRAFTLYITLWMTWKAFAWAAIYAMTNNIDGLQQAAVIAAVTAPVSALQVFVFKSYMEAKQ